jgi:hypothetical protein
VITPILQILGAIAGIVATYYLGQFITKWLQAYRTQRQKSEVEEARRIAQEANQQANEASDKLRDIEGR